VGPADHFACLSFDTAGEGSPL